MDVGNKEELEGEKKIEDSVNYPTPQWPPDCRFGGGNYVSSYMADSYGAVVWDHHGNSQPYSSLNQIGLAVLGPWQEPNMIPADSAFIERAARFSCFSSGNVTDLMNSFPMNHQPVSSHHQLSSIPYGPQKNDTNSPSTSKAESKQTESDEAESVSLMDTDTEPKGAGNKKKRRRRAGGQDKKPELTRQLSGEDANDKHKQSSPTTKNTGKAALEPQKEEYIHVRARRGQATNSHSLAERIRREKISERMKYLQDLVPGCSKVTGKAVMLDEIINYVQSLQRQVEFLSMKLATVNPKVDFNIDSLLAKEQLFPTLAGPSSSMGFSPDVPMVYPSMHPHLMNQGYKESTQQMSNVWDYDLQNVIQMGFDHSNPVENQEPSPLSPTHTKPEP